MMTVGCGLNAVQLPFSAHFDPKLPEMFLSEGTTLRGWLQKCTHPPTISPLLIQLKFISTQKGSLWKLTLIFSPFSSFCHFFMIFHSKAHLEIFSSSERFFLEWMFFLLECFYLFVKDICLLQFGRPPDSKLDLVCSNCLVLFCRILLELQHQTTSSHSSVRNTIFILFTRSDFFISFVYYECDFYMRKPTVEKFCNV